MDSMNNVKVATLLFTWWRSIADDEVNSVTCVHWSIIKKKQFHCLTLSARWSVCHPLVLLHAMPSSGLSATIFSVWNILIFHGI